MPPSKEDLELHSIEMEKAFLFGGEQDIMYRKSKEAMESGIFNNQDVINVLRGPEGYTLSEGLTAVVQ